MVSGRGAQRYSGRAGRLARRTGAPRPVDRRRGGVGRLEDLRAGRRSAHSGRPAHRHRSRHRIGPPYHREPRDELEDFPVLWAAPGTLARTLPWRLDPARSDQRRSRTHLIVTDHRLVVVGLPFNERRFRELPVPLARVPDASSCRPARHRAFGFSVTRTSRGRRDLRCRPRPRCPASAGRRERLRLLPHRGSDSRCFRGVLRNARPGEDRRCRRPGNGDGQLSPGGPVRRRPVAVEEPVQTDAPVGRGVVGPAGRQASP